MRRFDHDRKGRLIYEAKLARGGCIDCGLAVTHENFMAFDWDHVDPVQKVRRVHRTVSVANIYAEMSKCELRCANCHRIRTFRERHGMYSNQRQAAAWEQLAFIDNLGGVA